MPLWMQIEGSQLLDAATDTAEDGELSSQIRPRTHHYETIVKGI